MKRIVTVACLILLLSSTQDFANYKKDYCGNADYVGNAGNRYPHLHCGKDFLTLNGLRSRCVSPIDEIIADINGGTYVMQNNQAVITALTSYKGAGCP